MFYTHVLSYFFLSDVIFVGKQAESGNGLFSYFCKVNI